MELLEIAKKRFSVRDYTDQKVEPEKLSKILEAAHVAPTAANLQPIHLIVAQSDEALEKKMAQVQLNQDVPDDVLKTAVEEAGYQVVSIQ